MTTLFLCHPAALEHQTPLGHPERPDRIRAIERVLEKERFSALVREPAPMADIAAIARVHPQVYIDSIRNMAPREGLVRIDEDTAMSPGTVEAALRAAGAAVQAVDEVMTPRTEVDFIDAALPIDDARHYVTEREHSRYPVTGEDTDHILGFLHVRDLLTPPVDARVVGETGHAPSR